MLRISGSWWMKFGFLKSCRVMSCHVKRAGRCLESNDEAGLHQGLRANVAEGRPESFSRGRKLHEAPPPQPATAACVVQCICAHVSFNVLHNAYVHMCHAMCVLLNAMCMLHAACACCTMHMCTCAVQCTNPHPFACYSSFLGQPTLQPPPPASSHVLSWHFKRLPLT